MNLFRTILEIFVKDRGASVALTKVTQGTNTASKAAAKATGSFKDLAGAFTALVIASKVKGALESVIKPAMQMEDAMTRLAFVTGKNIDQLGAMKAKAAEVAAVTQAGPVEAVEAMVFLNRALRNEKDTMDALSVSAGLAEASMGKMSIEKSGKMVGEMAKAFGFAGDQITVAGDKILAVTRASGMGVENLSEVMGRLGMAAVSGGQSFDEMLTAFSTASRLIPSQMQASTLMISMMLKMKTAKAQGIMEKAGGVKFLDEYGELKSISTILTDMYNKSMKSADAMRDVGDAISEAFGARQGKVITAMFAAMHKGMPTLHDGVQKGGDIFKYFGKQIDKSKGSLSKVTEDLMVRTTAQVRRMNEAFKIVTISVGSLFLPAIKGAAHALGLFFNVISGLFNMLSPFTKGALGIVATMVALSALAFAAAMAFGALKNFATFALTKVSRATGTATGKMLVMTKALTAQRARVSMLQMQYSAGLAPALSLAGAKMRSFYLAIRVGLNSIGIGVLITLFTYLWEKSRETYKFLKDGKVHIADTLLYIKKQYPTFSKLFGLLGINDLAKGVLLASRLGYQVEQKKKIELKIELMEKKKLAEHQRDMLVLGTKPFTEAVKKIGELISPRAKPVDFSKIYKSEAFLKSVEKKGIGGQMIMPGGGKETIDKEMFKAAVEGQQMFSAVRQILIRSTKEEMSGQTFTKLIALATGGGQAIARIIHDQSGAGGKFLDMGMSTAAALKHQASAGMMNVAGYQERQFGTGKRGPQMKNLDFVKGPIPDTRVGVAGIDKKFKEKRDVENNEALKSLQEHLKRILIKINTLQREGVKNEPVNNPSGGGWFSPFGPADTPAGPKG